MADLAQPVTSICYAGVYGETANRKIYRFDQQMARLQIRYFAEYHYTRFQRWFAIYVALSDAPAVAKVAERLSK